MAQEKEYTGTITLGAATPTFDLESEPGNFQDITDIREDIIHETTKEFTGEIWQIPPMHSAIKQKGKPVYLMARKGLDVVMEPRKVTIQHFEITKVALPDLTFKVVCTTGTYIRSLANDFGKALGCGAYLSSLCRTRIGDFRLDQSLSMEQFVVSVKK